MHGEDPTTHTVYLDESGGHDGSRVLLLSACVHTEQAWAHFSHDWSSVLRAEPAIRAFDIGDASAKAGEFAGWETADVNRKVTALTEVLARHPPHVITCSVRRETAAQTLRLPGIPDLWQTYLACFFGVAIRVAQHQASLGLAPPADYFLDENGDVGYEALTWYLGTRESFRSVSGTAMSATPVFRDEREVLPLQAAGLVAWHKRLRKENGRRHPELAASLGIDALPGNSLELDWKALDLLAEGMSRAPAKPQPSTAGNLLQQLKRAFRKGPGKHP